VGQGGRGAKGEWITGAGKGAQEDGGPRTARVKELKLEDVWQEGQGAVLYCAVWCYTLLCCAVLCCAIRTVLYWRALTG